MSATLGAGTGVQGGVVPTWAAQVIPEGVRKVLALPQSLLLSWELFAVYKGLES